MALTGLFLTSMRGMMVGLGLFIIDCIVNIKFTDFKIILVQLLKKSIVYIPASLIFIAYNYYHYSVKGWIGYHENSPWAESFQRVDTKGFIFNIGILVWRILDFGRIFLWIIAIPIFLKTYKQDKKLNQLLSFFLIVLVCLSVSFVSYKYLNGHRYLLPAYLCFSLITIYLVFEKIKKEQVKYILFSILLIGMLSGNLWIYPEKVAKGWDSTLAHLPYYELRKQMLAYMKTDNITISEVGCVFPNLCEQKYLDLSNSQEKPIEKNLDSNIYVLYSNVYNGLCKDIDKLNSNFRLIKEFRKNGVTMRLYKKKIPF